jgi:hypothetical protein
MPYEIFCLQTSQQTEGQVTRNLKSIDGHGFGVAQISVGLAPTEARLKLCPQKRGDQGILNRPIKSVYSCGPMLSSTRLTDPLDQTDFLYRR